jgi:hypothetical protein
VVDAAAALAKAGELARYASAVPVEDDRHFGDGESGQEPARPGPDPVRLWIYGLGVVVGIGAFAAAVAVIGRR